MISLAVFVSGACALIYQTLWLRSFSLVFGGTTAAIALVLAVFMAGLALGSFGVRRIRFPRIIPAYALAEMGMGLTALLTLPLLTGLPSWYGSLLRQQAVPLFLDPFLKTALAAAVVLVPATLSGATLPLALEASKRGQAGLRREFGRLYALNLLGAATGVFAATFILLPWLGQSTCLKLASLANFAAGCGLWSLRRREGVSPLPAAGTGTREKGLSLPLAAFASGASAFILEVLWARSLSLVLGSSVYAFGLVLVAVLLGLFTGTWAYRQWGAGNRPRQRLAILFASTGILIPLQAWFLGRLPSFWFRALGILPEHFAAQQATGLALCFLALLPATLIQGYGFPLLLHLKKEEPGPGQAQDLTGTVYAWNTAGALLGSLGAAFLLIPSVGLQGAYVAAASLPLALALGFWLMEKNAAWKLAALASWALAVAAGMTWFHPWNARLISSGVFAYGQDQAALMEPGQGYARWLEKESDLLYHREGREAVVSVMTLRSRGDVRFLTVNGRTDASSGPESSTQKLLGHLGFLLKPDARQAMVIGWGSGSTAASALLHPLAHLECAEIEPAVWETATLFESVNFGLRPGARFSISFEDGRSALLGSPKDYDLVISQPSNPWVHGVSNLFTLEFYEIVRDRLTADGVFCQWFQYGGLEREDLATQFRTFCGAFPQASLWVVPMVKGPTSMTVDLCLLGSKNSPQPGFQSASRMLKDPRVATDLAAAASQTESGLLAGYVTDRQGLLEMAGPGKVNTDDRPSLEFSSPRSLAWSPARSAALKAENQSFLDRAAAQPGSWERGPWKDVATSGSPAKKMEWGILSQERGLLLRAEALLEPALAAQPGKPEAWLSLGKAQDALGKPRAAEGSLLKALRLRPDLKEALGSLGGMYYRRKDYEKCRKIFERMTAAYPAEAEAWFSLGVAQANLGDLVGSRKSLRECLRLDPQFGPASQFLDQIGKF